MTRTAPECRSARTRSSGVLAAAAALALAQALAGATVLRVGGAAAAVALAWPREASANAAKLDEGKLLYEELEERKAIVVLEQALQDPGLVAQDQARAHLYIGLCRVNLLDEAGAKTAFRSALEADLEIRPPDSSPPKARELFEQARVALASESAPPPGVASPAAPRERGPLTLVAYGAAGVGVVAAVGGIYFGSSASSEREVAQSSTGAEDARTRFETAESQASTANVMYVSAVVLAAAGVVLYLLDAPAAASEPAAGPSGESGAEAYLPRPSAPLVARF